MTRRYLNKLSTTLSAAIVHTYDTSVTLTSTTGWPTLATGDYYRITVDDGTHVEIMDVTAFSGTTCTVTRAVEEGVVGGGLVSYTFASGATVEMRETAASFGLDTGSMYGYNVTAGRGSSEGGAGSNNTFIGNQAAHGAYSTSDCTALGFKALYTGGGGANYQNTAIGSQAGYAISTGNNNTFVGYNSGASVSTTSNNVGVGYNSGTSAGGYCIAVGGLAGTSSSGQQNVHLGYNAGTGDSSGDNNIVIGYGAAKSTGTVSNEITLGNSSHTVLRCQTTSITSLSDVRDKKDIIDMPLGLKFINSLHPVKFTWNTRDGKRIGDEEGGFIAQELLTTSQVNQAEWLGLVLTNNPDRLEASQGKLIPVLVKAIQELSARIEQLENR